MDWHPFIFLSLVPLQHSFFYQGSAFPLQYDEETNIQPLLSLMELECRLREVDLPACKNP